MTFPSSSLRRLFLTSATVLALAPATAHAAPTLIGETGSIALQTELSQPASKTTQIRFDDGTIVSFVGEARYTVTGDRSIRVETGNVTVLSPSSGFTVSTPSGEIEVSGGSALTVTPGGVRSHVFSGATRITAGGRTRGFTTGQAWESDGSSISRIVAAGPQAAPTVRNLREGGIRAAALNGLPISLGEALAALGASSDVIAAGRSFDVASRGLSDQQLQALPADFERLLDFQNALAARLSSDQVFAGASPAILDAYLRYLAGGGRIAEFQSVYAGLIASYLQVLQTGGFPSDFTGLSPADIQAYLDYLSSVGNLAVLGEAQQALIAEYLAFLQAGGVPADFIFTGVQLDAATIDLYFGFLSDFVAFVRGGGAPGDFTALEADLLARYVLLLENAGQLSALFGPQADVFLAYAEFLAAGGNPNDFTRLDEFGLSDALIAEYTTTLTNFLAFLFDGGTIADFGTDAGDLAEFILALEQAGALETGLTDERALLLEFAGFVRAGGVPSDYLGFFTLGLSDAAIAQYSVSITALLELYAMGGAVGDFTGDLSEVVRFIQILEAAGALDTQFADARTVLLSFVAFLADGGAAGDFDGFVTLGFDDVTLASYVASITTLLDFFAASGTLAGFDGDVTLIVELIRDLEASGQLTDAFGDTRNVLIDFVNFVEGGGTVADYRGFFALGLSTDLAAAYAATIQTFLDFLIDGGTIADFDGDLDVVISNLTDLDASGQLGSLFPGVLDELLAFLAFLNDGGVAADFTGFDGLQDTGGGGTGGGGGGDTGAGFDAGPEVSIASGIDADEIAELNFRTGGGLGLFEFSSGTEFTRLSPITFNFGRFTGTDDNGLPRDSNFDLSRLELITADLEGDILMMRHAGPGNYRFGGNLTDAADGFFVDSVIVTNTPVALPTAGQVIYDLDRTLGVRVNGDGYDGEISLDMVLGLQFGAIPRVAFNGVLTADTEYVFSSGADGTGGIDFSDTTNSLDGIRLFGFGRFTSGVGAFCSEGATCSAFISGLLNADFTQIGAGFTTSSSNIDDLSTAAIVSFLARDASSAIVEIPNVSGSGSVTSAPVLDFNRGILLRANGGSDNRRSFLNRLDRQATLEFDSDGALSVMFRGFSNAIERGDGVVADLAGNEDWQVGRWLGPIGEDVFGQNSGYAYAVIPVLTATPAAGRIEYSLLGASSPVYGNGATAPGTFDGNAVLVIGTENLFGLEAMVTMPDATYTFSSEGGVAAPSVRLFFRQQSLDGAAFNLPVSITGNSAACPAGTDDCTAGFSVGVGGENGQYAGITYRIGSGDAANFLTNLTGTAVFGGDFVPDGDGGFEVEGVERENQFVAYSASTIGIDQRRNSTVVYDDTTGAPLAYRVEENDFTREQERPEIGSATVRDAGSDGDVIGWGRWAGGTTAGRYFALGTVALPGNGGWHVISGTPATNLPTSGTVQYDLIGHTAPTVRSGTVAPGTLDSAQAAVAFGTIPTVGFELGLTIGGESYSLSTNGGVADPSQGLQIGQEPDFLGDAGFRGDSFNGTLTASGGSLCSGGQAGCNATATGFLAGDGATHLGLAYTFGDTGFDSQVDGTVAFRAAGAAAPTPSGQSAAPKTDIVPVALPYGDTKGTLTPVALPRTVEDTGTTEWSRWEGTLSRDLLTPGRDPGLELQPGETDRLQRYVPDWISYERR